MIKDKLNTFAKKVPHKVKVGAIVAIVAFILVWFVLPLIPMGGSHPFAGVGARILVLVLLALVWNSKHILAFFQKHKEKALPKILEQIKRVWQYLKSGGKEALLYSRHNIGEIKDKIKKDQKRRRLRRLPWYLVLGSSQSGKKTMIKNTGLYFASPDHFGEDAVNYINQAPDFEWWFSEQAVLIDAMSHDVERNQSNWRRFVKVLKRERKNKPLNGIILNFSLTDLLLYKNQDRQNFIQDVCGYIRKVHETFKSIVPVYLIFNKCDLVEGFMEFFNDLSKEELRQVWGMTLPLSASNDLQDVQVFFQKEYNSLVQQLRKRVMWALDSERTERGRELINAFPQQMQLFKRPIENFITELFGATRYPKALQLRGIYFTSCTQDSGEPVDFVMQAMSKKFQLVPPKFQRPQRLGECYFMQSLFYNVIYNEAGALGFSERSKRIRNAAYKTTLFAFPVIIILAAIGMHNGYRENVGYLRTVNTSIQNYNAALASIQNGDPSLTATLPALDQLNSANQLYQNSPDWGLSFLYTSGVISGSIQNALENSLHSIFLPRIAAQLEHALNQNIQNLNVLYATLKGYLAFSANAYTGRDAIKAPMEYGWKSQFLNTPQTAQQLRNYLNVALQRPITKLPLDNNLINNILNRLERVIPSERAYGLLSLKAKVSGIPGLLLPTAVGGTFSQVFTTSNNNDKIPALYTRSGFEKVFETQYQPIANEVAQDNRDIGLANDSDDTQSAGQISAIMQSTYQQQYTKAWNEALANIQVAPFTSLNGAVDTLNALISKQSPLAKLLQIVYDNTSTISDNKVEVTGVFESMNNYTQGESDANWSQTVAILTKIRDYLVSLQHTANPDKAAFDAAKMAIQGTKSPIQELTVEAEQSPQPVKRWLNSIANDTWQIVVQSAHDYIDDAWDNNVMQTYNAGIRGRYPLAFGANSQVSITNFNDFFSNGGILENFFNLYLKDFINTSTTPWSLYTVNGHSIEIPKANVQLFEQAARIRQEFFPHKAKQASFTFSIMPLDLDSNASSIQLIMGTQHLTYSHGPQDTTQISWPMPFNEEQASIIITDFDDDQYTRSASGPWALFKLFDYGLLKQTANNGTYSFSVNLNNYNASYQITGSGNARTFSLADLHGFALPDAIAPSVISKEKSTANAQQDNSNE